MDKDAYYFPHFSNARNDRKIRRLRKELGVEGYGIYFMILEVLREQKEFKYPMEDIDLLADEFRTSDQKVRVVVCNYNLFEVDEKERFFSPKFIEYLNPYLERKLMNKVNGVKGNLIKYNHATKAELEQMTPNEILRLNDKKVHLLGGDSGGDSRGESPSDRKERKEKESKVKEINTTIVTSIEADVPNASDPETWESAVRISEHLLKAICDNDPTHKYTRNPPALHGWAKQIDLALRRDGRTEEQLKFIINAVFYNSEKFSELWEHWDTNVESGKKLRDQFDKIKNQIKKSNGQSITKKIQETDEFLSRYAG